MSAPTGVLLMAYGTPAGLDDVEAYYTHIRRGRPPEPALLAELIDRYRAIGGGSPLLGTSRAQQAGLQELLGESFSVVLGMKHAPPFIEDAVTQLAADGITEAVAVVLAPHYSALSVGEYIARVKNAAQGSPRFCFVHDWHLQDDFLALLADRVAAEVAALEAGGHGDGALEVIFTAHSLPSRIVAEGDPYPTQLAETAEAIAGRLGLESWSVAWQSAGRTDEPWLGPSLLDVMRELATAGRRGVVVCPAGFTADHLETMYDLDIEARALADKLGLAFRRTEAPNADPRFLRALADVARSACTPS